MVGVKQTLHQLLQYCAISVDFHIRGKTKVMLFNRLSQINELIRSDGRPRINVIIPGFNIPNTSYAVVKEYRLCDVPTFNFYHQSTSSIPERNSVRSLHVRYIESICPHPPPAEREKKREWKRLDLVFAKICH